MNREIKFKVQLKKENKLRVAYGINWLYKKALVLISGIEEWIEYNRVYQYTGLQDKNGVDIYEGDIVEIRHPFKDRYWKGEVIYDGYQFTGEGFFFSHFDNPDSLFSEGTQYIEVLGNIYENPELLKK